MESPSKEGLVELKLEVDPKVYGKVEKLAGRLNTTVTNFIILALDVLADYSNDIADLGGALAVGEDKRAVSTLEELIYYGVESWRSIINPILDHLKARGCYELESLDFDPLEPFMEVEMVALEGCKYKVDRFTLTWSFKGVSLEAYYYLEQRTQPSPRAQLAYEWSYLPDDNAVVISITAPSILQVPPLDVIDKEIEKLGV